MNTWEIDEAADRHKNHPVLGPATRLLAAWRDVVNANSDGWAYWAGGSGAASRLMELIAEDSPDVTDADVRKASLPIKRCCKKFELPFPQYALDPPPTAEQVWLTRFEQQLLSLEDSLIAGKSPAFKNFRKLSHREQWVAVMNAAILVRSCFDELKLRLQPNTEELPSGS